MTHELYDALRLIKKQRKTTRLRQLIAHVLFKGKLLHLDELDLQLFVELFPLKLSVDIDEE